VCVSQSDALYINASNAENMKNVWNLVEEGGGTWGERNSGKKSPLPILENIQCK